MRSTSPERRMNPERERLTPQQRLSISRHALIEQMQDGEALAESPRHASGPESGRSPWRTVASHMVQRWWRRHPANAAGQLAQPLLERYAREQPAKLVAAAAATGALVVLTRPWRLLPAAGIVAAILKSSDAADLITTLMKKTSAPPKKDSSPRQK
jgi:hypothetical protein